MRRSAKAHPILLDHELVGQHGHVYRYTDQCTGCDSIVTLNLTVHPVYDTVIDEQICEGTQFDFHGTLLMCLARMSTP